MDAEEVKEFRLGELFCGPGGLALAAITDFPNRLANSASLTLHLTHNTFICSEIVMVVPPFFTYYKRFF